MVVTIKKTSWCWSKKFEDIDFENTQTFSVPNGRIELFLFNDFRWEEIIFKKVMSNFNQGNTINISRNIRRYKKISIFKNFLVVEFFFSSNYTLTLQSSDYILKWRHQECFLGNFSLALFRSSCYSHPFSKVSPENTADTVLLLVKLQAGCSE